MNDFILSADKDIPSKLQAPTPRQVTPSKIMYIACLAISVLWFLLFLTVFAIIFHELAHLSTLISPIMIFPGLLFLILLLAILALSTVIVDKYRQTKRLLMWGLVARASITHEEEYEMGEAGRALRLFYEFIDNYGRVVQAARDGVPIPGAFDGHTPLRTRIMRCPIAVYDREDSSKCLLYPADVADLR